MSRYAQSNDRLRRDSKKTVDSVPRYLTGSVWQAVYSRRNVVDLPMETRGNVSNQARNSREPTQHALDAFTRPRTGRGCLHACRQPGTDRLALNSGMLGTWRQAQRRGGAACGFWCEAQGLPRGAFCGEGGQGQRTRHAPLSLCPRSSSLTICLFFRIARSRLMSSSIWWLILRASASRARRASFCSGDSSGGGRRAASRGSGGSRAGMAAG